MTTIRTLELDARNLMVGRLDDLDRCLDVALSQCNWPVRHRDHYRSLATIAWPQQFPAAYRARRGCKRIAIPTEPTPTAVAIDSGREQHNRCPTHRKTMDVARFAHRRWRASRASRAHGSVGTAAGKLGSDPHQHLEGHALVADPRYGLMSLPGHLQS
jgi:hypothetical protein